MAKKKTAKKQKPAAKKKAAKKAVAKKRAPIKHEIVVRVQQAQYPAPTTQELAEPMRDGKKMTLPKTWLSEQQLVKIVQRTPKEHVYRRKGKGGKEFDYVTGAYVEKVLNFVFGWNWDLDVLEHGVAGNFIWVKAQLTVRGTKEGQVIKKTQFGRAEIKYLSGQGKTPAAYVDFGNDLKAATTDALKKCASLLGIASDIYGKTEYKQEADREPREAEERTIQIGAPERTQAAVTAVKEKHGAQAAPAEPETCHGPTGKGCQYGNDIEPLPESIAAYSIKVYGRALCRDCQKDAKPLKK